MKVPCKVTPRGDKVYARNFIGAAQSQMRILENEMTLGNQKQGVRRVRLNPRTTVTALICFSLREVIIDCLPIHKIKKGKEFEKLPKLYVYVTISDYVTIWDLLTGEVAEDVCNNEGHINDEDGNPLITFPCHKDELVKWLEGIPNKPTRQVLRDNSVNNRDYLDDNYKDAGNENRVSDVWDNPDWLYIRGDLFSEIITDISGGEGTKPIHLASVGATTDDIITFPGVNYSNYHYIEEDTVRYHPEFTESSNGKCIWEVDGPTINVGDCVRPFPLWSWGFYRCKYQGNESNVNIKLMLYLESYKGVEARYSGFYPELTGGCSLSKDGYHGKSKIDLYAYIKNYTVVHHGKWYGTEFLHRSLMHVDYNIDRNHPNGEATLFLSPFGGCLLYQSEKDSELFYRRSYYYTYTTLSVGDLILDLIPIREIKKKEGNVNEYKTIKTKLRELDYSTATLTDFMDILEGADLGENAKYITNACPQYEKFYFDKIQLHDFIEEPYTGHRPAGAGRVNLSKQIHYGTAIKNPGAIGVDNRFAITWCTNLTGSSYMIKLYFYMHRAEFRNSGERKDNLYNGVPVTPPEITPIEGFIGERSSSVQATVRIANYKDYPKENLTINDNEVTTPDEEPRRYERIKLEDIEGNRVYPDNDEEEIYPFDGTYDIFTLGEAVEELINGHYVDGSDDQLLVYLYERPDMIEEEV